MSTDTPQTPPPKPSESCLNCGALYKDGALFCDRCGAIRPSLINAPPTQHTDWRAWALQRAQYRPVARRSQWRRTLKAVMAYLMLSVVISLIAGLITLVYGIGIVAPDILDSPDWADGHTLFIVVPIFIDLFTISGYALLTYYFLIVAAIIASCAWVFLSSYKGFLNELTMKAEPRNHTALFDIAGLIFVEMFALLVVVFIAFLLGISDTESGVSGTTSELLFLLANASVWEELIVRVLLIGLPLLVIDLAIRKKPIKWGKYIFGGGFNFGIPEIVLLTFSAAIFGYAHYIGGWEAWIVPWDALGGLTFGYLFLRHGLASAIVLHFIIDYRGMPTEVFGLSQGFVVVLIMLWMALGAVFTIYYLLRIGEFFTGKKYLDEKIQYHMPYHVQPMPYPPIQQQWTQNMPQNQPPAVTPGEQGRGMVPPQQGIYGGYVCPSCGGTEARWANGKFQCLRCGRLS